MDLRKEAGPFLPNKFFPGNIPLRKHQVFKKIHLHCVGKNVHTVPRATFLIYCRVRTSEVYWEKSKSEMEFNLQSLQQIMINLGLFYPQVLDLVTKYGDLGFGTHNLKCCAN